MEALDNQREKLIKKSRDIIKLSKQIIYAVHRKDLKTAAKYIASIKKEVAILKRIVRANRKLDIGSYKAAIQEYVEAICYYSFVKQNKIPTSNVLDVDEEYYLLGLCDLTGELTRKAINLTIAGKYVEAFKIKNFVSELYDILMQFDFRTSELRKMVDGMRYDVKRLDDLVLALKMKDLI